MQPRASRRCGRSTLRRHRVANTRATYTEAELARLYVTLVTNEGNVKRTSRDTGIPESTVRRWKQTWEAEGPPKLDEVEQVAADMVTETEAVRDLALQKIKERLEND